MDSQARQLSPRPYVPIAQLPSGNDGEKKKRKPAQHPPPGSVPPAPLPRANRADSIPHRWKEDNWRLTRKLLQILLEPEMDTLRRALWPRVGETPVGGSKIDYQTELARKTFEGWEHEDHVREEPRWYGARVKDYMHK